MGVFQVGSSVSSGGVSYPQWPHDPRQELILETSGISNGWGAMGHPRWGPGTWANDRQQKTEAKEASKGRPPTIAHRPHLYLPAPQPSRSLILRRGRLIWDAQCPPYSCASASCCLRHNLTVCTAAFLQFASGPDSRDLLHCTSAFLYFAALGLLLLIAGRLSRGTLR